MMTRLPLLAFLIASSVTGAFAQDPNIFIPPSATAPRAWFSTPAAHTNHLIYIGHPMDRPIYEPLPLFASLNPSPLITGPAGYHPEDIRAAYKLPSTGGKGAIAIVDAYHYPTAQNDFNVFAKQFGLPQEIATDSTLQTNKVFQVVYANGKKPATDVNWSQEAALDIEWAHAMAPGAKIYLVEAASSSLADMFAAVKKAGTLPGVTQVSMSFGSNEWSNQSAYDVNFKAPGVVYFASAGDTGGIQSYPATSPFVVGVGGSSLKYDSVGKLWSESAWSGSGGGPSVFYARPAAQNIVQATVGTKRGSPDISFVADPYTGCSVYDSTPAGGRSGWMVFGGTSLSAPCCAGICNLSGHNLASTEAELNRIYTLGLGSVNFRDISKGSAGKFTTKVGWDFVTGVGSPIGLNGL